MSARQVFVACARAKKSESRAALICVHSCVDTSGMGPIRQKDKKDSGCIESSSWKELVAAKEYP
jgi:hypothetical protein